MSFQERKKRKKKTWHLPRSFKETQAEFIPKNKKVEWLMSFLERKKLRNPLRLQHLPKRIRPCQVFLSCRLEQCWYGGTLGHDWDTWDIVWDSLGYSV